MRLQRLYELQDKGLIDLVPFFYSAPFTAGVAAAAVTTVNVPIQSDSHFICRYLTGTVLDNSTPKAPVAYEDISALMNLFDTSSGRSLFDNPQPWQNVIGNSNLPFVFPEPWLIRAGGQVQVTFNNIFNATYNPYVSLVGMKVYQFGSQLPPDLRNI